LEVSTMTSGNLLERARRAAGLSQQDLARRAHTSRTAVSAYENGHKSPSLSTAERLLAEAGYELDARPRITFHRVAGARGRRYEVPDRLPHLSPEQALATVQLPLPLNWSDPGRAYRLAERADRARVYETVLREGTADDVLGYVDGALLVDLWPELVLPRDLRAAWSAVIDRVLANE
jgi:transcriptional regulator with XRE-family HTH domain